jgi:hypothetical protein
VAFGAARGDGTEDQVVAGPFERTVEAFDDLRVELLVQSEGHADRATAVASQQAGTLVGSIGELLGRLHHPLPSSRAGSRHVPEDYRHQGPGHAGALRNIRHGHDGWTLERPHRPRLLAHHLTHSIERSRPIT